MEKPNLNKKKPKVVKQKQRRHGRNSSFEDKVKEMDQSSKKIINLKTQQNPNR